MSRINFAHRDKEFMAGWNERRAQNRDIAHQRALELQSQSEAAQMSRARLADETARRGQDIQQQLGTRGHELTARGQDVSRELGVTGHALTARGQDIGQSQFLSSHQLARDSLNQQGEYQRGMLGVSRGQLDLGGRQLDQTGRQFQDRLLLDKAIAGRGSYQRTIDPETMLPATTFVPGVQYDQQGLPVLGGNGADDLVREWRRRQGLE